MGRYFVEFSVGKETVRHEGCRDVTDGLERMDALEPPDGTHFIVCSASGTYVACGRMVGGRSELCAEVNHALDLREIV